TVLWYRRRIAGICTGLFLMVVYFSPFLNLLNFFMLCLLSIEMYPPVFVSKPDPMTLYVGKQAVFQCSLTGSSPMEVVWHKDSIAISSEGNYVMKCEKNKYSLHIKSLELTNQGTYLCKASNSVGTATFTTELKVIGKPSFVKIIEPASLESLSSLVGSEVSLHCSLKGSEPITVSWLKDNHELKEAENIQITYENKTALLHITNLQSNHGGKYSCQAQNQAGSQTCSAVSCDATLTILGLFLMCITLFLFNFILL
uniref:Ig-like domain-containing protein n=1 Tax=Amphilophus citrinellus TaxID=61819 RepID=A0A3Q0QW44_AMPCI